MSDHEKGAARIYPITVLTGDGIGPEIVGPSVRLLEAAAAAESVRLDLRGGPIGLDAIERYDNTIPEVTLDLIRETRAFILGPITSHIYDIFDPKRRAPSGHLRKLFDLFANIRPARSFPNVQVVHSGVDLVVVRENTEGFYADRTFLDGSAEFRPDQDMVLSFRLVTRRASTRIARAAFELARQRNGRKEVTVVHKANVLRRGDGLFVEACRAVAAEFPDIKLRDLHVDAAAMHLAAKPQQFDVIVTTNLFGDVLSDEAAGVTGGLGLAAALNAGEDYAMAQATHGSAPDIAGRNIANPTAMMLSSAMLCDWLATRHGDRRLEKVALRMRKAVIETLSDGSDLPPDLGGSGTTTSYGDAVLKRI